MRTESSLQERRKLYTSWVEKYQMTGTLSVVTAVKGHASSMNLLVQVHEFNLRYV